ncbi:hypothetical protein GJA_2004 [Janthinobacterium agaricidamnosum NBRC 102515 = DSM 9628]|uniref:Uncharacterized protein n=1 Tax=Janthinobacterium agaricidamnosum NBRC 102515 = DSM 9628 TaxID=1349767 RepID=W0V435_9BURK|nr:hypothetical protein GJA_2004 [Janthinobacterium agaricidamnosum NBRC 102515 = DSM 9628]
MIIFLSGRAVFHPILAGAQQNCAQDILTAFSPPPPAHPRH